MSVSTVRFFCIEVGNINYVNKLLLGANDLSLQQQYRIRDLIQPYFDDVERAYPCILSQDDREKLAPQISQILPRLDSEADSLESAFEWNKKSPFDAITFAEIEVWREALHLCCLTELFCVLPKFKSITEFDANKSRITAVQIREIADNCPDLEVVQLANCPEVSDTGLERLLTRCKKLMSINLAGTNITDQTLANIAGCEYLLELSLIDCPNVTDRGVAAIAKQCKNLSGICMNGSQHLTVASISSLIEHTSEIQHIGFPAGKDITDSVLYGFIQKFERTLESIDLTHCSLLTDASLLFLAQSCSKLELIKIQGCNKLTEKVGSALAKHCPLLKEDSIFADEKILKAFKSARPSVEQLAIKIESLQIVSKTQDEEKSQKSLQMGQVAVLCPLAGQNFLAK